MNPNEKQNLKPRWQRLAIIECFANVLYPIDLIELLRQLPKIGYVVPTKVFKGVVEAGEAMAAKGNIELRVNQNIRTLGVEGREVEEVIEAFNDLRNFWLEHLDPSPNPETRYMYLSGEGRVRSQKNPIKVFSQYWSQFDKLRVLSKVLGCEASNFGLRLSPTDAEPNSVDWLDVQIYPLIVSSANQYYINIVWRNKDLTEAIRMFSKVDEIITNLIREVEKG